VVLRPPLEAAGRGGPEGVESRVPSRRIAEVRRALVGQLHMVGHMGLVPHSRGERMGLLLRVVVAALFLTVLPSPDEGHRGRWPVVAQPKEVQLRNRRIWRLVWKSGRGSQRVRGRHTSRRWRGSYSTTGWWESTGSRRGRHRMTRGRSCPWRWRDTNGHVLCLLHVRGNTRSGRCIRIWTRDSRSCRWG
jgi:hypothetical protein